jgi:UDP-N-acetylglucosamine--N-acetylmuramyl-(pentapeptide) pyrophosphoryl-undecaprenol N-acetylglucosamine transferase
VDQGGGWLIQQRDLTPDKLANATKNRALHVLLERALQAKTMQKTDATARVVAACEELAT